jgi:hypothetical protein
MMPRAVWRTPVPVKNVLVGNLFAHDCPLAWILAANVATGAINPGREPETGTLCSAPHVADQTAIDLDRTRLKNITSRQKPR